MKKILSTASTPEEALEKVVSQYDLKEGEYEYKVIDKGFKGFLGLFSKEAQVEVILGKKYYERKIKDFLEQLFKLAGIKGAVSVKSNARTFYVSIDTTEIGRLIGKHGKTLAALQHIVTIHVNRASDVKLNVVIDAGDYREKRKKQLEAIAKEAIRKAIQTKEKVELDPMFPFERRIIHEIVKRNRKVTSYSVGVEPYRRVVIEYISKNKVETRR